MPTPWQNKLYFGDNLEILRRHLTPESVDLIYLDPPFNSQANYNMLFKETNGRQAAAQVQAFEDFWHWAEAAPAYFEVVNQGPREVAKLLAAFHDFLGQNDMMAYLSMMAIRLVELRRVLKPTGSIYLHCDPTASHYLKLVMDAVFGKENFRSELIWQRSLTHGGGSKFNATHDVIFYYSKGLAPLWNAQYQSHDESYLHSHWGKVDEDGRQYQLIVAHGAGQGPPRRFGDREIAPPRGRHWAWNQETIDRLLAEGLIVFTASRMPRYKVYLDESQGKPVTDVWTDIFPINSMAKERLGYPTQKPEALLERIISASSNEGDLVLDPFCGCGTTVAVAERLHRRWIGIDITHLAIGLMRHRLQSAFGPDLSDYEVLGEPEDLESARALFRQDPYQFQFWALSLVEARPAGDQQKKGADQGIDGWQFFFDDDSGSPKRIVISVKGGHATPGQVRDLIGVVESNEAEVGVFITLQPPTRPMLAAAAGAGRYQPPGLQEAVPKVQILTIADLLQGHGIQLPPRANATFKRAPRRHKARPQGPGSALTLL